MCSLSCSDWRRSGDLPMRTVETLSLTVTLPNEQRIKCLKPWSGGREGREPAPPAPTSPKTSIPIRIHGTAHTPDMAKFDHAAAGSSRTAGLRLVIDKPVRRRELCAQVNDGIGKVSIDRIVCARGGFAARGIRWLEITLVENRNRGSVCSRPI